MHPFIPPFVHPSSLPSCFTAISKHSQRSLESPPRRRLPTPPPPPDHPLRPRRSSRTIPLPMPLSRRSAPAWPLLLPLPLLWRRETRPCGPLQPPGTTARAGPRQKCRVESTGEPKAEKSKQGRGRAGGVGIAVKLSRSEAQLYDSTATHLVDWPARGEGPGTSSQHRPPKNRPRIPGAFFT